MINIVKVVAAVGIIITIVAATFSYGNTQRQKRNTPPDCEQYRFTPQGDTPMYCINYFK